jgi:hypothetical protein
MRFLTTLLLCFFWTTTVLAQDPAPAPEAEEIVVEERAAVIPPAAATDAPPAAAGDEDPVVPPAPVLKDAKVPVTDEEVGAIVTLILDAAKGGHWQILAGLLILLVVFVFNKLGLASKIGPGLVPWFAVGLGILTSVAIGMASDTGILPALQYGFIQGGLAVALWELIAKHLLKGKSQS